MKWLGLKRGVREFAYPSLFLYFKVKTLLIAFILEGSFRVDKT
jgi:hypothetical protein